VLALSRDPRFALVMIAHHEPTSVVFEAEFRIAPPCARVRTVLVVAQCYATLLTFHLDHNLLSRRLHAVLASIGRQLHLLLHARLHLLLHARLHLLLHARLHLLLHARLHHARLHHARLHHTRLHHSGPLHVRLHALLHLGWSRVHHHWLLRHIHWLLRRVEVIALSWHLVALRRHHHLVTGRSVHHDWGSNRHFSFFTLPFLTHNY